MRRPSTLTSATLIPSLKASSDYKQSIREYLESSLKNLECTVEVLFFHDPAESALATVVGSNDESPVLEEFVKVLDMANCSMG